MGVGDVVCFQLILGKWRIPRIFQLWPEHEYNSLITDLELDIAGIVSQWFGQFIYEDDL